MGRKRLAGLLLAVLVLAACGAPVTPSPEPTALPDSEAAWLARYSPAMHADFTGDLLSEREGRPTYAIEAALTVDEEFARFKGTQTVQVTNTSPDDWESIVFRLYPNLRSFGGEMTITSAAVEGQAATPELDTTQSVLTIPLAESLPPGETTTITLSFETTITAGHKVLYNQFSYLGDVIAAPDFYPVLSVYEPESGWWQSTVHQMGDATYSETAFYDVWLTAPDDWVLASSGVTLAATPSDDDTVTYEIVAPLMRDFAVMASQDYTVLSETVDGVQVNLVGYEAESTTQAGLELATGALQTYNTLFGPYPFAELDVVETPTEAGGIEYPGLIVLAENAWNPSDSFFITVMAHEVAHQWWFSVVGNNQIRDPWLDESLTQYSALLAIRESVSANAANGFMAYIRDRYESIERTADDQVIGLPVSDYGGAYFNVVYYKGPLFFLMWADRVGEDQLLAALQDYYTAYRYENVQPVDMLGSFEDSLGRDDLDAVFREWVGDFPGLE